MIRVIWLLRHPDTREQILASCVAGEGFSGGRTRIADRAMAEDAANVNGWVPAVYRFGNTFVHLTNAHDYAVHDPFQAYEHRGEVMSSSTTTTKARSVAGRLMTALRSATSPRTHPTCWRRLPLTWTYM